MAAPSRTAQFTRLHKILARHYKPVAPDAKRSVLEHLLFACCLENAHYNAAEEAFAAMVDSFFDWNEIRVSTVRELSEVMAGLPDPRAAAQRFKRVLQSIFEATYAFDLEELRKLSLGAAQERLEKIDGTTRFSIAYVTQVALGGHAIPLDSGTLGVLALVNLASEAEVAGGSIAGLERAIPKTAGLEFASLVHQLGADYVATPFARSLHQVLLEIDPSVADRLPRRRAAKAEPAAAAPETPAAPATEKVASPKRKARAGQQAAPAKPARKAAGKAPGSAASGAQSASPTRRGGGESPATKDRKDGKAAKPGKVPASGTAASAPGAPGGVAAPESAGASAVPVAPLGSPSAAESDGAVSSSRPEGAGTAPSVSPVAGQPPLPQAAESPVSVSRAEAPGPAGPSAPPAERPAAGQRDKRRSPARPRAQTESAGTSPTAGLSKRKPR